MQFGPGGPRAGKVSEEEIGVVTWIGINPLMLFAQAAAMVHRGGMGYEFDKGLQARRGVVDQGVIERLAEGGGIDQVLRIEPVGPLPAERPAPGARTSGVR